MKIVYKFSSHPGDMRVEGKKMESFEKVKVDLFT